MTHSEPERQPQPSRAAQGAGSKTGAAAQGAECVSAEVLARARQIALDSGHKLLAQAVGVGELQGLNNALMDLFREQANVDAYTLLFDLNLRPFSLIAARIMRMTGSRSDLNDILQETFLAIYRYPSRFRADKPNAFRNWSYSIIRNTVYRHLHRDTKDGVPAEMLADVLVDERTAAPGQASEHAESDARCRQVYGLVLTLYMEAYQNELKPRDRLALELVEVRKLGYREAAAVLGIRLENFKMVVCRARKKILQSMVRVLGTRQT